MAFFYAPGVLVGCLLLVSCNQSQQPETKAKAAEDPRMAGFKGKIDKTLSLGSMMAVSLFCSGLTTTGREYPPSRVGKI